MEFIGFYLVFAIIIGSLKLLSDIIPKVLSGIINLILLPFFPFYIAYINWHSKPVIARILVFLYASLYLFIIVFAIFDI